jgi:hypothetical protein
MSNDKRWQDMTPDEQAVAIRQISGRAQEPVLAER